MIVGIDPKVDYAFKHLFGREATRPILIDLVNQVLNPEPGHRILDIELLNPFNPKEALDDKLSILDIKARDQTGRQFNVEMQILAFPHYVKRILFYACKLHQQQLHEGEDYAELKPTISISFLDHILFPQVPDHHLRFLLLEQTRRFTLGDELEFHILELPKFTKSAADLASGLDIWLYFLRYAAMMDIEALPAALGGPLVASAFEELKMLSQTDLERERYESRRKAQLDDQTKLRAARMEGHEAGRREGRQIGRDEGEKIGAIQLSEQLLNRPQTPTADLARMSIDDLTRLADDLKRQVLEGR